MFTGMLHTHKLVVTLFLLLYLIKTVLLLLNKSQALQNFSKKTKVLEIIISTAFLLTGIYLAYNSGSIGSLFWIKIICVAASIPLAVLAFKKSNKGFAILALVLIIAAYGLAEMSKKAGRTKPEEFANAEASQLGKTIYEKKCMNCHGENGKAGLSGAKDLTLSVLSHDEKVALIKSGKNAMMSFQNQLNDVQIHAIVDYISQLK